MIRHATGSVRDAHLLPGRGNIAFARLARAVATCGWRGGVIVEARRRARLHQHRAAWRRILADEAPARVA